MCLHRVPWRPIAVLNSNLNIKKWINQDLWGCSAGDSSCNHFWPSCHWVVTCYFWVGTHSGVALEKKASVLISIEPHSSFIIISYWAKQLSILENLNRPDKASWTVHVVQVSICLWLLWTLLSSLVSANTFRTENEKVICLWYKILMGSSNASSVQNFK